MTEFVLLGVADIAIGAKNASWRTNKIGGKAVSDFFFQLLNNLTLF